MTSPFFSSCVADVHCPTLRSIGPPLIAKIEGPRLGESATFDCPNGYRLEGTTGMTCQYNGKFYRDFPFISLKIKHVFTIIESFFLFMNLML